MMKELAQLAPVTQAPLTTHVFVCTGKSCANKESEATLEAFYTLLAEKGLLWGKRGTMQGRVMVTACGSIGLCSVGPAVLVYPEGVWYHGVTATDVAEIVESHLIKGQVVDRLFARTLGAS